MRAYVDDVRHTEPKRAAEAVAAAIQVWELISGRVGAVLSRTMCALAGNSPEVRRQLRKATEGEGNK